MAYTPDNPTPEAPMSDAPEAGPPPDLAEAAAEIDALSAEVGLTPEGGGEGARLAELLQLPPEKGESYWQAAQSMPATQGKTPEEVAQMMQDDYSLRTKLMEIAAQQGDATARDAEMDSFMSQFGSEGEGEGAAAEMPEYPEGEPEPGPDEVA